MKPAAAASARAASNRNGPWRCRGVGGGLGERPSGLTMGHRELFRGEGARIATRSLEELPVVGGLLAGAGLGVERGEGLVRRPVCGVLLQGRLEPMEGVLLLAQAQEDAAQFVAQIRVVGVLLADQVA